MKDSLERLGYEKQEDDVFIHYIKGTISRIAIVKPTKRITVETWTESYEFIAALNEVLEGLD